jgi:hypothetical protein
MHYDFYITVIFVENTKGYPLENDDSYRKNRQWNNSTSLNFDSETGCVYKYIDMGKNTAVLIFERCSLITPKLVWRPVTSSTL